MLSRKSDCREIRRRVMYGAEGVWVWDYRGRCQHGTGSNLMFDEEVQDTFIELYLDDFKDVMGIHTAGSETKIPTTTENA